jgi:hypothetical protein
MTNKSEPKEGDVIERTTWEDGTVWVHKWIMERPGLLHLVWMIEKKGTGWNWRARTSE